MPPVLSGEALFYALDADDWGLGYILNPSFPTANSLVFQAPIGLDKRFFDSLNQNGYMPFRHWSLTMIDAALREVGRYTWYQTRVAQLGFPGLDNQFPKPPHFSLQLAVTGIAQGNADPKTTAFAYHHVRASRTRAVTFFKVQLIVDGLKGADWSVSKVRAFNLGEDLVLTITPDQGQADPYRDWFKNGNTPRNGSLNLWGPDLQIFLTVRFTGLRVRTISPTLSTFSSNPATIHLTYSGISFGPVH